MASEMVCVLTREEAKKAVDYCDRLDYEYELWDGDADEATRSGDIDKRRWRNGDHQIAIKEVMGRRKRGDIEAPIALLGGLITDFTWLLAEWANAIGDMDSTDAASYRPRLPALERFIGILESKRRQARPAQRCGGKA